MRLKLALSLNIAAVFAMAFWWGGLTLYSLVAVPIGIEVLGGETEQGFITRQVAKWINFSGAATLVLLIASTAANWRFSGRLARFVFIAAWITMAVSQTLLLAIHPRLDAMLNLGSHSITEPEQFHKLHEIYLTITGIGWFAGLVYLLMLLLNWPSHELPTP